MADVFQLFKELYTLCNSSTQQAQKTLQLEEKSKRLLVPKILTVFSIHVQLQHQDMNK